MKKQFFVVALCFGISTSLFAATKKCSDFSKEASQIEQSANQKQKQLGQVDQQIKINQKAMNEFGQKCKSGSNPNCNPTLFSMIAQQTATLNGQRQKISNEILNARMKQEDALQNFKSCKQLTHGKTYQ